GSTVDLYALVLDVPSIIIEFPMLKTEESHFTNLYSIKKIMYDKDLEKNLAKVQKLISAESDKLKKIRKKEMKYLFFESGNRGLRQLKKMLTDR
ncbi:MAG: hypothetical protein KKF44_04690, partial [Nanoarchaeota archaeon]|nr:hypothetical protein [Nanoarchaeota archaeon]